MATRPQITITMSKELLDRWKKHIENEQTDGTVVGRKLVEQYLNEAEGKASAPPAAQGAQLSPDVLAEIKRVVRLENDALYVNLMRGLRKELMEVLMLTRAQLEDNFPELAAEQHATSERQKKEFFANLREAESNNQFAENPLSQSDLVESVLEPLRQKWAGEKSSTGGE